MAWPGAASTTTSSSRRPIALARRAADRPRELMGRAKSVLDASLTLDTWQEAFELELTHQDWSMDQPAFQGRLAELRAKLQKD